MSLRYSKLPKFILTSLLQQTLDEEGETDKKLTGLSQKINREAQAV